MNLHYWKYEVLTRSNLVLRLTNSYTNISGTSYTAQSSAYRPSTTDDYMVFDGLKTVKFSDQTDYHVVAPYSIELDFYTNSISSQDKFIATCGEGYGMGWGEWSIFTRNNTVMLTSSSTNNGNQFSQTLVSNLIAKKWYRIGVMFYENNGYRVRGYLNNFQIFDIACSQPYNSANGIAIGSDWAFNNTASSTARIFNGRIRNFSVAKSLFWNI